MSSSKGSSTPQRSLRRTEAQVHRLAETYVLVAPTKDGAGGTSIIPSEIIASDGHTIPIGRVTVMPTTRESLGPELYAACEQNDVSQVKALCSTTSRSKWTNVLTAAGTEGAADVAAYCIAQGAVVNDVVLRGGIICSRKSEPVYRFLVESGAVEVSHWVDHWGTMLGIAANSGRHSMVRFLLEKGASPNTWVEAQSMKTPLACAASSSDDEMVKLLLDHGAQMKESGALVLAAEMGRESTVKLLIARGADVNELGWVNPADRRSLKYLGTPLHKAVERGHAGIRDILLQAGADVSLKDAQGRAAADIGEEKGLDAATTAVLRPDTGETQGSEGATAAVSKPDL